MLVRGCFGIKKLYTNSMKKYFIIIFVLLFFLVSPAFAQNLNTEFTSLDLGQKDTETTVLYFLQWLLMLLLVAFLLGVIWVLIGRAVFFKQWKNDVVSNYYFQIDPKLKKKIRSSYLTSIFLLILSIPVFYSSIFFTVLGGVAGVSICITLAVIFSGKAINISRAIIIASTPAGNGSDEINIKKEKILKHFKFLKVINIICAVGIPIVLIVWLFITFSCNDCGREVITQNFVIQYL